MMRRKSNSRIRVGFLGKRTTYQAKESFKRVPETTEEKKKQLEQLLQPWSLKRPGSSYVYGSNVADSAPAPSPSPTATPFPTPTPSPIVYTVSIQPSSATQYENVILSASTNLSSPTFVWSLTDFRDTSGNTISSYTGSVLTEGYFVSTGSGNVSVVATGTEGSATGSTFSVSEYVLSAETNVYLWYDFADESTWTTRVDAGTTYLTSLADKSGNGVDMVQSTASKQPILSGSATNGSLSAATFDGSTDYLLANRGSVTTPTGTTHIWMGRVYDGGASNNDTLYWHMDALTYNADSIRYLNYNEGSSNQLLYNKAFYNQYKRNDWTDRPLTYSVRIEGDDATPPTRDVVMVNGITTGWTATAQANTGDYQYVALGAAIHNRDTANTQQMKGEIGEYIFFEEAIDDDTFTIVDRYLGYKWFDFTTNISGSLTPTQYVDVTYSVDDLPGYGDKTFSWTMPSDWVGTTTGSSITGYFTGTTGGNVSVVATNDWYSKTDSISVSVSSFSPDTISGLIYWIDPSDESSVSTRTSGSDVFVESINNLASTSSTYSGVSNSVAVEQPYYITSTGMTNGLKTIMNTGFRSTYTTSLKDLGNVVTGDTFTFLRVGYHGVSSNYYAFQKIGMTSTSNRIYLEETGPTSPTNDDLRIRYRESGSFRTTWKSGFWNGLYSNSGLTYGFVWENNGVDPWQFEAYIDGAQWTGWTSENTVAPTANFPQGYGTNFMDHVLNASAGGQTWDGYEELGEWVCYNKVLSQSEITSINLYLTNKWGI